jgi:hypothetical protein
VRTRADEPDADVTFVGRRNQEALVAIHDHLRDELDKVLDLVDQLRVGGVTPEAARSHVATMTMRQNYWTLGAFCAAYCRLVTMHHTIEDSRLFADLRQAEPELEPVLARLSAEHEVVAATLDALDQALVLMVEGSSDGLDAVDRAVAQVAETLLAHLDGEENVLAGPLGRMSVPL